MSIFKRFIRGSKMVLNNLYKNPYILFLGLLFFIIIQCIITFYKFSVVYTDSDQLVLWQVAIDLMRGSFHGFCFYGQSYNSLVEPFFALPFLFCGMDLNEALPLITIILGTGPFIILSFYLYKKVDPLTGLLPLFVFLLLSPEFSMLTSISRGFVTGVFFGVIGFVLTVWHESLLLKFFGGLFFGIGIYVNPNSILLYPLLLPFLSSNSNITVRGFIPLLTGFFIGSFLFVINWIYYHNHQDMVIHKGPNLNLSFASFMKVINSLDNYFDFISPVIWRAGWLTLLFFVIIAVRLWRYKQRMECITVCILFASILFSFAVSKVSEGTNSVFFSGSRMFITYPFILIFLFTYLLKTFSPVQKKNAFYLLAMLTLIIFPVKLMTFDLFVENAVKGKNSIVEVAKVNEIRTTCKQLLTFASNKVELVIANSPDTPDQLITYGCPCLIENFPPTVQPLYERRSWILPTILNIEYKHILLHGRDKVLWKKMRTENLHIIKSDASRGWLLIENDLKTTRELLTEVEIQRD